MMRRKKRDPRNLVVKLPEGAFVEVVWLPDNALHKFYLGRIGSIVQRDGCGGFVQPGIYVVTFEDGLEACFVVESLRLV